MKDEKYPLPKPSSKNLPEHGGKKPSYGGNQHAVYGAQGKHNKKMSQGSAK